MTAEFLVNYAHGLKCRSLHVCVYVQTCCCGNDTRSVLCGSQESFELRYTCGNVCGRSLNCGQHCCEQPCHAGPCERCSLQPDLVTRCPCGKTVLASIPTAKPRMVCTDEIPTCQLTCLKPLPCGTAGNSAYVYFMLYRPLLHFLVCAESAVKHQANK